MGYLDRTAAEHKGQKHTGPGWDKELVQPFLDIVCKIDPDTPILQIKEKFGTLRLYHGGPDWCEKLANLFELASEQCCEECGKWNGHYYDDHTKPTLVFTSSGESGWVKTLCMSCHDARNAEWLAREARWKTEMPKQERQDGDVA